MITIVTQGRESARDREARGGEGTFPVSVLSLIARACSPTIGDLSAEIISSHIGLQPLFNHSESISTKQSSTDCGYLLLIAFRVSGESLSSSPKFLHSILPSQIACRT